MTKKNKNTVKKKITLKNFKDYILELLNESDNKGITLRYGTHLQNIKK